MASWVLQVRLGKGLDRPGDIKSINVSIAAVLSLYVGASRLGLMKR